MKTVFLGFLSMFLLLLPAEVLAGGPKLVAADADFSFGQVFQGTKVEHAPERQSTWMVLSSSAVFPSSAFVGMGAQPPIPEWGTMLADAREFILRAWWVVTFPGLAILAAVLAFNLMGDGLRDTLDPKLRRS